MLRRRAFLMIATAAGLGLSAAGMVNGWVKARVAADEGTSAGTPVAVAALEIPFGKTVEAPDVRVVRMPKGAVPPGAYHDAKAVKGKIANQRIYPGEPLLKARVVEQLGGGVLAASVTPKKRAVSVRVNDVVGVGGFLLPGSHVDVLASRQSRGHQAHTRIILQNLRVLAVDQTASPDENKPVIVRAVTLEMSPKQAETLVTATREGSVQLALRNPLDKEIIKPKPKPKKRTVHVRRHRSRYVSVEVIKGTRVSKARIRKD